jgi:hypothetical protein
MANQIKSHLLHTRPVKIDRALPFPRQYCNSLTRLVRTIKNSRPQSQNVIEADCFVIPSRLVAHGRLNRGGSFRASNFC